MLRSATHPKKKDVPSLTFGYAIEQPGKAASEPDDVYPLAIVTREGLQAVCFRPPQLTRDAGDKALAVASRPHCALPVERHIDPRFSARGNLLARHDPGFG